MAYIKNPIQAVLYSKFRPSPPKELVDKIVDFVKEKINSPLGVALDVGCGSGQSTEILSPYFQKVIGIDSSAEQLKHAQDNPEKHKNVFYRNGSAEKLDEVDSSVNLVTVGMAAHWFDLERFSAEVGRVLCPNGVLALYGYSLPRPSINGVCLADSIHSMIESSLLQYFPEESRLAYLNGYKGTKFSKFSFSSKTAVRHEFLSMNKAKLRDLIGYISTMSAFQNYMKTHGEDSAEQLLYQFTSRVTEHVGGTTGKPVEEIEVEIKFPYFLLLSRKNKQ